MEGQAIVSIPVIDIFWLLHAAESALIYGFARPRIPLLVTTPQHGYLSQSLRARTDSAIICVYQRYTSSASYIHRAAPWRTVTSKAVRCGHDLTTAKA